MKVGDRATCRRRFARADVDVYVALGGARPADGLVPPALLGGVISRLLGVELPGPGANYLKQGTRFLSPAPLDEWLDFAVEVTALRPDRALVDLATTCRNGERLLAEGRALIYVGDRPAAAPLFSPADREACL